MPRIKTKVPNTSAPDQRKQCKYNELNDGQYFTWKGKLYRKLPRGMALHVNSDRILDFGFGNVCEPVERPRSRIDLVIQYLHWALVQAYAEQCHDDRFVTLELDLERKQTITSYGKRKR